MRSFFFCSLLFLSLHAPSSRAEPAFSLEALDALFKETNASSVEEILPFLPGELRSRYVIVEDSRGLQEATREHPRIILRSAGLFLAFNGGNSFRNGNTLEAIEQRSGDGGYEFRRYIFPKTGGVVVQKNEKLCLGCHGKEPKPLWSPFPFWPGVLGEGQLLSSEEEARLREFATFSRTHSRYRHLLVDENIEWALHSGMSPAWTMQDQLEKPLARLLARQLFASPLFSQFRYGALASLALCDDVHGFIPRSFSWNQPSSLAAHRLEIQLELGRLEPAHRNARVLRGPGSAEILSRLHWITGELGLETGRWGGNLESRYFLGGRKESLFELIEELMRLDPALALPRDSSGALSLSTHLQKQLFGDDFSSTPGDAAEHEAVCQELKTRSLLF